MVTFMSVSRKYSYLKNYRKFATSKFYGNWVRFIKIYDTPAVYAQTVQIRHLILRILKGVSKTRAYIDFRKLNFTQTKPVCVYIT